MRIYEQWKRFDVKDAAQEVVVSIVKDFVRQVEINITEKNLYSNEFYARYQDSNGMTITFEIEAITFDSPNYTKNYYEISNIQVN